MNSKRVLIAAPVLPEYDREGGSRRIFDFIEVLQSAGWSVTFLTSETCGEERYVRMLQQRGVATHLGLGPRTEQMIAHAGFDVAVLAFWHFAESLLPTIRRLSPSTRIVVDSIDLHFVRHARQALHRGREDQAPGALGAGYANEMARELNIYAAADAVLTVSGKEAALVNDLTADPGLAHSVPLCEDLALSTIPADERRGILFLGNFRHHPNVEAVEFLCRDILPRLSPTVLSRHPVSVVGNALGPEVRDLARGLEHVRMVGWVPSILPYLERARLTVIPLLYGAGTRTKLIQALMVGTPTVSTTVGAEGLGLVDGEHVLLADDPARFAECIRRLVDDDELWTGLANRGRARIEPVHGRDAVGGLLLDTLGGVLRRRVKLAPPAPRLALPAESADSYSRLRAQITQLAQTVIPRDATVAVVSRGDDQLLSLYGRRGWHFPQTEDGTYAGYHPADSASAIAHLEALRQKGAGYLLLPRTAFWWLDHYPDFHRHLEGHYQPVLQTDECRIFALHPGVQANGNGVGEPPPPAARAEPGFEPESIERLRPLTLGPEPEAREWSAARPRVLVVGVYLASEANNVDDIVATLADAVGYDVVQRWVALGGPPPSDRVAEVTTRVVREKTPKFRIINDLLAEEELASFEYVLLVDDDIVLPRLFLDRFLAMQGELDFALAQPARTANSFIDHPIVEQQQGVLARETLFVEIGPVVSFHRSLFDLVFPFDLTSAMGWGYENVWSKLLSDRGLKLGIVDATPVDHSLRAPVKHYSWHEADRERDRYFRGNQHRPYVECFRVLGVIPREPGGHTDPPADEQGEPLISVVIPTYNRAELLRGSLESLVEQSLPSGKYEVVVVDDGSTDETAEVCRAYSERLRMRYRRIANSGISAAKNLGLFTSTAPLTLFFDDDDLAHPGLLEAHVRSHREHPEESAVILGYTTWAPELEVTPVMEYVMDVGQILFSYRSLAHEQVLDYTYFWGGRSSCKRSFLARHGIFNQSFRSIIEDIELSYRLSRHGLKVIHRRDAISYMIRPITFEAFARRCERVGEALWRFSRLHPDPVVAQYCRTDEAIRDWPALARDMAGRVARIEQLEQRLSTGRIGAGDGELKAKLWELYRAAFRASQVKGIVGAMHPGEPDPSSPARLATVPAVAS